MKKNEKIQISQNIKIKPIFHEYQPSTTLPYYTYQSPTYKQLQQQELSKIGKPFSRNVQKLVNLFTSLTYQQFQGMISANYMVFHGFHQDEITIPKSFKICCCGVYRLKCKAEFYYIFNEQQRCYYLEHAQNKHYHQLKKPRQKTNRKKKDNLNEQQKKQFKLERWKKKQQKYHIKSKVKKQKEKKNVNETESHQKLEKSEEKQNERQWPQFKQKDEGNN